MLCNNTFNDLDGPRSVDIVTVWYNREPFVYDSIMSLIEQSHPSYRIIVVDDGSTDRTPDSLEDMLRVADDHGVPMCLWCKENEGFTISLKKTIENKCDADTIALHGAGDRSSPERIKSQHELLSSEDGIVATGVSAKRINKNGEVLNISVLDREPSYNLSRGEVPRLGTHGCAMYDFDAYKEAGGYRTQFTYSQDIDLWLRLIKIGSFKRSEKILYSRLYEDGVNIGTNNLKTRFQQILCYEAAVQSALCREHKRMDPINNFEDQNFPGVLNIAKNYGFCDESMKKLVRLVFHSSLNSDIDTIRRTMSLFSMKDLLVFIKFSLLLGYRKFRVVRSN